MAFVFILVPPVLNILFQNVSFNFKQLVYSINNGELFHIFSSRKNMHTLIHGQFLGIVVKIKLSLIL